MNNPNSLKGLFQTLVLPAASDIQTPEMFEHTMLRRVYIQNQPQPGNPGKYIEVNIPAISEDDVIDIGDGPIQITGMDHSNVTMEVNNNLSKAFIIPDMSRITSPMQFRDFYLAPAIESVLRKCNRAICNLVTTANFSAHATITAGADVFTRGHLAQAWANLRSVGAPNTRDQTFVTGEIPYANMLATADWIQQSTVGDSAAAQAQQTAQFAPAFNAAIEFDQQFPQPTEGATYAGLFFHKHAIAMIPVLPPMENKPHVEETTYQLPGSGLTFRIQFGYDFREQGWVTHVHAVFALAVVRPRFGSYLVTT